MASQFPPEALPIIDPGNVPLIRIDGLESYEAKCGWVLTRFFTVEPMLQHCIDFSLYRPRVRKLCLALIYSRETGAMIRRQLISLEGGAARH